VDACIADDFEMRGIARLTQHRSGIAADRLRLTRFKPVVIVQNETMGLLREATNALCNPGSISFAWPKETCEGKSRPVVSTCT
jgi:hypothetical protein